MTESLVKQKSEVDDRLGISVPPPEHLTVFDFEETILPIWRPPSGENSFSRKSDHNFISTVCWHFSTISNPSPVVRNFNTARYMCHVTSVLSWRPRTGNDVTNRKERPWRVVWRWSRKSAALFRASIVPRTKLQNIWKILCTVSSRPLADRIPTGRLLSIFGVAVILVDVSIMLRLVLVFTRFKRHGRESILGPTKGKHVVLTSVPALLCCTRC
jgi:hypothetical protein